MLSRFSAMLLLVSIPFLGFSQSNRELGVLPVLNLNKKLKKDWSINLQTESRNSLVREEFDAEYLLTDVSFIAAKKLSLNTKLAGGFLSRFEDDNLIQRSIQQLTIVRRLASLSLAHRIAADQTFFETEASEWRIRYRLSTQLPLSGQSLDPREFFLKMGNEYLSSWQADEYDLEVRATAFLGYAFDLERKVEVGLDYRIDRFISGRARNRFWIGLNYYFSI